MRRKISLYIADRLVDLDDESFILFNYTMEDMSNPTIVRNSFSQQITLKGTANNNRLFGEIWRSDRVTQYGGSGIGVDYDATKKTPFTIFNEMNEILESGYCKLDKITRKRNTVDYTVTLYGGLGSFFYALSYDEDGNKRTLADLKFTGQGAGDDELTFTINRSVVLDAWKRLRGDSSVSALWDILNFCPAYNGLPGGTFDADKGLFKPELSGVDIPAGYSSPGGDIVLASLAKEYTEWEIHDLRSYLQRPVIKMSEIIDAICQSYNNGGYTVDLDATFFRNDNPYYTKTWLTLPIINTLDVQITEETGNLTPITGGPHIAIPNGGNLSTNYAVTLALRPSIQVDGPGDAFYLHCEDVSDDAYFITYIQYTVRAYGTGDVLLQEKVFKVSTIKTMVLPGETVTVNAVGHFDSNGDWVGDSVFMNLEGMGFSYLTITVDKIAKYSRIPSNPLMAWTDTEEYSDYVNIINYAHNYTASENVYRATSADTARTGATITKKMLLSGDKTPADYLLSYCKQFGLVFLYDKGERKVSIMRKQTFYQDTLIDLTGRVDISQPIGILPYSFDTRWYDFSLPYDDGEFAKYYANIYDRVFGLQKVNTGYGFNADSKDLLEGIVFRGACEVQENSKYFGDVFSIEGQYSKLIPAIFQDSGATFSMQNGEGEPEDLDIPPLPANAVMYWWNSIPTYDFIPRLQFHDAENASYEERDTLVFFDGFKDLSAVTNRIAVTDDTTLMMLLNGNTPCWILEPTLHLGPGSGLVYYPVFSRYLRTGDTITGSLDFGTPAEVQIPNAVFADDSSMYDQFWKNYIADRYDDDSKVMTCKVNLSGMQVNESLLRNFFYYDGCIWALNKIINHSLTTFDDTECEFIKIQDKTNYLN